MSWVTGKSAEEILEEMYKVAEPGSIVFEQQKAGIQVRLVGDLCRAIEAHRKATSRSSWLMAALTFGLVLASAVQVWKLLTH
jgi:hypothetical protein